MKYPFVVSGRFYAVLALLALMFGGGIAFAQVLPGAIHTSPVVVPGSFNYNGGPQTSVVDAHGGTFTCATSAATVANTYVTANSVVLFSLKTVGGTVAAPFIATITTGTGFTLTCGAGDTSTYNYIILG